MSKFGVRSNSKGVKLEFGVQKSEYIEVGVRSSIIVVRGRARGQSSE